MNIENKEFNPLLLATLEGDIDEMVSLLKENRKCRDYQDIEGFTALHFAALRSNLKAVEILLCYGANPELTNSEGLKPIDYAEPNSRVELILTDPYHNHHLFRQQILNGGYLMWYLTDDDEYLHDFWSLGDYLTEEPGRLDLICELILQSNDEDISYIAAGVLEDLFKKYYAEIEQKLTIMVRKHRKMRIAITGVWASHPQTRATLDRILNKFGLVYGSCSDGTKSNNIISFPIKENSNN